MTEKENRILSRLFRNGPSTRAEIADALGMRRNTVGDLCVGLIEAGAIEERDADRARNVRLSIPPDAMHAVGVRHTREGFQIVVMDAACRSVVEIDHPLPDAAGASRCTILAGRIKDTLREKGIPLSTVTGIGFADHGITDDARGRSVRAAHIPGWDDIPIREILEREIRVPVSLIGFTDAAAALEMGGATEPRWESALCMWLNRSIGLSVFLHGEPLRGNHPVFGEAGHIVIEPGGAICRCGNRGCLETVASTDAILQRVRQGVSRGAEFRSDGEEIAIGDVIANAKQGNKLALRVLEEAGRAVGRALAMAINILGISNVLLMGELIDSDDIVISQIREAVRRDCVAPINADVQYRIGAPRTSVAAGAAYLAFRRHFDKRTTREKSTT